MARSVKTTAKGCCGIVSAALSGVACGAVLTGVAVVLLAGAVFLTADAWLEEHLSVVAVVASFSMVMLGAALSGWRLRAKGLLVGALTGFFYAALALALGIGVSAGELSPLLLANKFVSHMLAGALGGVIGVNLAA